MPAAGVESGGFKSFAQVWRPEEERPLSVSLHDEVRQKGKSPCRNCAEKVQVSTDEVQGDISVCRRGGNLWVNTLVLTRKLAKGRGGRKIDSLHFRRTLPALTTLQPLVALAQMRFPSREEDGEV